MGFLLPCMPINPCPLLFRDMRGQVPAFSARRNAYGKILCSMLVGHLQEQSGSVPCEKTITATHLAYQAPLQQNPVQYARQRVCGKNRDRFRLKKKFCLSCKPTNLNPKTDICSRGVNVAAIAATLSCFPCVVSAAEKMPTRTVLLLCQVLICAAKFPHSCATAKRTREKCGLFLCGLRLLDPVCDDLHSVCGQNRQPVRVERFLPCKPTDPFPVFFPNVRSHVSAFSRAIATQCACSMLVGESAGKIGIGSARRNHFVCQCSNCGKNVLFSVFSSEKDRVRFRVQQRILCAW